jgi:hypothetical protein
MSTTLDCFANAPFSANTPVTLTDSQALTAEVLPAGALILNLWANADTAFSSAGNLIVGWSGNNSGVVGASGSLTTTSLNTSAWHYIPSLGAYAGTSDQTLTVTCDSAVTTGKFRFKIEYNLFSNI